MCISLQQDSALSVLCHWMRQPSWMLTMTVPLMLINWATVAVKQGLPLYFSRDMHMRPWQINCTTVCISEIYIYAMADLIIAACRPVAGADEDSQHHLLDPPPSKEKISLFKRWDKHEKHLILVLAGFKCKGRLVPSKTFLGLHGML